MLARYIIADDPFQTPLAESQVAQGGFVPITVLLELAWLLGSRYAYDRSLVARSLEELGNLPRISLASEHALPWVVERLRAGADIGDLIHLVASEGLEAFVTFDDMTKKVGADCPIPIEVLN